MAGRKKLSEIDKAKSKASRTYLKFQGTLTVEFEAEQRNKEIQFAKSEKSMGRPPVKLSVLQERALASWKKALDDYRELEEKLGLEPISEVEIIEFKKNDNAGRKAKDEVQHLKKYIRRTERVLQQTKDADESSFAVEHKSAGRPGMTKSEKIEHYADRLKEANEQLNKMLASKPLHEQIYYKIFDLQVKRRELNVSAKNASGSELKNISDQRSKLDKELTTFESQHENALKNSNNSADLEKIKAESKKVQKEKLEQQRNQKSDELKKAKQESLKRKIEELQLELKKLSL